MILLRDADDGPEVLLVQRNPEQRFMGGAWVFPGGAEHDEDADHAATAVRELEEEAGVALGDAARGGVLALDHPAQVKVRFDTWFFVAEAPRRRRAARATAPSAWTSAGSGPPDALAAGRRDELMLVFPTIKHLEQLAAFGSVAEALASAAGRAVEPVEPRVVARDGAGPRAAARRARATRRRRLDG